MRSKIQTPFTHRQYMLSQDFEIYYYSDTRHNNVDLHSHDYYEFYFYMEGDVEFEIGDRRQALRSGDFVIVPPGTMHRAFVVNTELPYRRFVFSQGFRSKHGTSLQTLCLLDQRRFREAAGRTFRRLRFSS